MSSRTRWFLVAGVVAWELVATALAVIAFDLRHQPPEDEYFEGRAGTTAGLLNLFSEPQPTGFTTTGRVVMGIAILAALAGVVLGLAALWVTARRRKLDQPRI